MRSDRRRVRCDLLEAFTMVNGLYDLTSDTFLKSVDSGRRERSKKLFKRRSRLYIRKYVFANRIVDKWNVLPDSCMECTTLNDIKTKIKLQLEPETQNCNVMFVMLLIVDCIWRKPVSTYAISVSRWWLR